MYECIVYIAKSIYCLHLFFNFHFDLYESVFPIFGSTRLVSSLVSFSLSPFIGCMYFYFTTLCDVCSTTRETQIYDNDGDISANGTMP